MSGNDTAAYTLLAFRSEEARVSHRLLQAIENHCNTALFSARGDHI